MENAAAADGSSAGAGVGDLAVGFTLPQIRSIIDALTHVHAASLTRVDWVRPRDWRAQMQALIGGKIDDIKGVIDTHITSALHIV